MSHERTPKLSFGIRLTTVDDYLEVFLCTAVRTKESLEALMSSCWCIMSTSIEPKNMCKDEACYGSNINFRTGMTAMRM